MGIPNRESQKAVDVMNEFEQQREFEEMNALKEASPQWKSQPLPGRDSLQLDVTTPVWGKAKFEMNNQSTSGSNQSAEGSLEILVAANGMYAYGFIVINVSLTP